MDIQLLQHSQWGAFISEDVVDIGPVRRKNKQPMRRFVKKKTKQ